MIDIIVISSTWPPEAGAFNNAITIYGDRWDDFGYQTLFHMSYFNERSEMFEIGSLKIYSRRLDELDSSISASSELIFGEIRTLADDCCSLGCDLNYYKNLKKFLPLEYKEVLKRLRDMATNEDIKKSFMYERGVVRSLRRESSSEKALLEANYVMENDRLEEKDISFQCQYKAPYSENWATLRFQFKKQPYLPYRICAIVGKNGTGKTNFLSELANVLSGLKDNEKATVVFGENRPPIDRVMSISYSVFDEFSRMRDRQSQLSYVYCGLHSDDGILSYDKIQDNFKKSYSEIINRGRFNDWEVIIKEILEAEHQDILQQIEGDDFSNFNWSSGQHILISTMTELICNIEKESLILFDEPEIHLHPNAIANVMRMFSKLLEKFDSYAIFATHSPIVLQEIPSENIQVIEKIDNGVFVRNPLRECFGDNISEIITDVFDVTEAESYYKQVLKRMAEEMGEEQVYELFKGHLNMNARIYLNTLYRGGYDD